MILDELDELRKRIDKELDELYKLSNVIYSLKSIVEYFKDRGVNYGK